jgi:O-antigen/teichoic acid export membrane protein
MGANTVLSAKVQGSRMRNYLLGLSSGYVVTILTIAVGLWLTPFTLRFLDREQFAIFTLASDLLVWLTVLDLGMAAALKVQAAQLSGRPDQERLNRLASTTFFAQCLMVIGVVVLGSAAAWEFPHFFPIRPGLQHDATSVAFILLIGVALSLGSNTFSALLIAHQQMHVDNSIRLLLVVLRTVLTVILLKAGWGLFSLAYANLIATLTTTALAVFRTYRLLPGLQIRRRLVSVQVLKETWGVAVWFFLGGVAVIMIMQMDRAVTAKCLSVEMVTTLSLTGRTFALVRGLLQQITNTARPMLGQMLGENKPHEAFRAYRHIFALSTGLAVVASAALWAGNGGFVTRWVGAANYGGIALDSALAAGLVVQCWNLPNRALLSASMIVRPQTLCGIVEGLLNVCIAVLLAKPLGLFGVCIAMASAGVLTNCWYLPLLTARVFNRPFFSFLWEEASRLLLLMLGLVPVAILAKSAVASFPGYWAPAVAAASVSSCGLLLFWFCLCDRSLKNRILCAVTGFGRISSYATQALS